VGHPSRQWRGCVAPRPAKPLVLCIPYEGNQTCRLVREFLTELNIPLRATIGWKDQPRRKELKKSGATRHTLIDQHRRGHARNLDNINYLYKTYARVVDTTERNTAVGVRCVVPTPSNYCLQNKPFAGRSSGGNDKNVYEKEIEAKTKIK
jgi:hypothetical protein